MINTKSYFWHPSVVHLKAVKQRHEKEYEKLSNERVFPAALGGNLELCDGVCT
jgi:hypothetical protein